MFTITKLLMSFKSITSDKGLIGVSRGQGVMKMFIFSFSFMMHIWKMRTEIVSIQNNIIRIFAGRDT